jgi:hypothetical protein
MKKLMLLSLLVKKQTVQQSTQLPFLIQAISLSHAHSYTFSLKCHIRGSTTQPRHYSYSLKIYVIPQVLNISYSLNFITWMKNKYFGLVCVMFKLEFMYDIDSI